MNAKISVSLAAALAAAAASADLMDRERGIKIGERLTLEPRVSFSYTYDSNVDSSKHSRSGSMWNVNPNLSAVYLGDGWNVKFDVHYMYHAYNHYSSQLNSSTYGERLSFDWADSLPNEPGWRVLFAEKFDRIAQDDDMSNDGGRGIGRDRKQFTAEGVVERRLNSWLHANVNASYYFLEYDNNVKKYAPLYGWKRAQVGGEIGAMASKWTDFILSGGYQWFWQDNDRDYYNHISERIGKRVNGESTGWYVMGGIATRATEKLAYRILGGYSRFDFSKGAHEEGGFTYQASLDYQADAENTLHFMMLASSYYQPSEREFGSATKVYNFTAGVAKGLVRNKLRATVDFAYRHETHEYVQYLEDDYDSDIWTGRIGLAYSICRFVSIFGRVEYQSQETSRASRNGYDYDRWRGTVGFSLSY